MKKLLLAISSIFIMAGAEATSTKKTEPDNSAVNKRDRAEHELTAEQQSMSSSDTEITARIRQAIVANKNLSTYAHNVKIITINGNVTLKGPVESTREKNEVYNQAVRVAGRNYVTNELEVAKGE